MKRQSAARRGFVLAGLFILPAVPAAAYVGPGAGITMLGALWGLVLAVAAAVGFLVTWPLRRYIFRRKRSKAPAGTSTPPGTSQRTAHGRPEHGR
jgi:membrane protein implicated in regulation of membrane protease activity